MKYLKKIEAFAQDMMSISTSIKPNSFTTGKNNAQNMMSIPTTITDKMALYEKLLQPYYVYLKTIKGISNLSPITYEQVDDFFGFSFIVNYNKIMILTDKISVYILINEQFIPITKPLEIIKIIESEAI
ncbi:MAG: hypothetical protein HPY57_16105 [Ignavibacteria bacterium]|nr:hypothetical protein [Ignavibacteria bacterium]